MNGIHGRTSSYFLAALMCWVTPAALADEPSASQQQVAPQYNTDSQALVDEITSSQRACQKRGWKKRWGRRVTRKAC